MRISNVVVQSDPFVLRYRTNQEVQIFVTGGPDDVIGGVMNSTESPLSCCEKIEFFQSALSL